MKQKPSIEALTFIAEHIPKLMLLHSRLAYITQMLAEKNKEWLEVKNKDASEFDYLAKELNDLGFPVDEFFAHLEKYADIEVCTNPRASRDSLIN